jgi:hypothetical protein
MKFLKYALFLISIFFVAILSYSYTHSYSYAESVYTNKMNESCSKQISYFDRSLCLFGADIIRDPVVNCMRQSFWSTSDATIFKCIEKELK